MSSRASPAIGTLRRDTMRNSVSSGAPDRAREARARIEEASFPCVGAKAAAAQGSLAFVHACDLRASTCDAAIVAALQTFAGETPQDAVFVTRIVLFPSTPPLDEVAFERAVWNRLGALHRRDAASYAWDPGVSSDPESPRFSFSLGGRGFYVIGLHPGASRGARRFGCAALVFNLHSQFETLRADGRYDKLRDAITERDIAYAGSRNPMLASFGTTSEARQYSGREVDDQWRCPFSPATDATRDAA